MKQFLLLVIICFWSCKNETTQKEESIMIIEDSPQSETTMEDDYDLAIYDYDGLKPLINKKDNNVHVVNFWATWCAPCVKELPYFEAVNEKYKEDGIEVLLVSLDFPKKYDSALKPYIKKHNLKSQVVAFDDTDQNRWIPEINKDWSGAIPATIIYKGNERKFYEKSFTQKELETEINKFLK